MLLYENDISTKEAVARRFSSKWMLLKTSKISQEKNLFWSLFPRILESLAGCRTMLLFAVFCKIDPLERNAC